MRVQEKKLTGGRITADVVRVGETVHRTHNANSDFVKAVLIHLENKAVDFAPRWLGMDEQGRDVFSYMPGSVPDNLGEHSDEQCAAAARMIARIHVSLSDMPGCTDGLTVCHRDLSPCNFVFDKDMPVGIIDWDAAAVGNPINDLAYAMWMWLDIGNDERDARDVARRMRVMRDAYGVFAIEAIYAAMLSEMARVGGSIFPTEEQTRATYEWTRKCAAWCARHKDILLADSNL